MKLFEMHLERQQHGSTHKTFLQNFDLLLFCFSVALMFCPQMVSCPTSLSYFDNDFCVSNSLFIFTENFLY